MRCCKVKHLRCGAEGKPSLKRAKSQRNAEPEPGDLTHVQDEAAVKGNGGPGPTSVEKGGDEVVGRGIMKLIPIEPGDSLVFLEKL